MTDKQKVIENMTKLYIVEGLPCSGKSTTSKYVAEKLIKLSRNVICIDEGSGNHPADYEFHAYVGHSNLSLFTEQVQTQITECCERIKDGYIVPLSNFEGEVFDRLLQFKIYDFLPWEVELPLMLEKWQRFVRNAESNTTYVFNCVFLQNPMCETMMRFGYSEKQSFEYISKISEIIKPLNPTVIYLKNEDISERVNDATKERDGWLESVINYHIDGAYGKSINAQGFDGYIACLNERQCRELSILGKLPVKNLVIDNAHRNWIVAYKKISDFIESDD